jgi:hypothetical protein
VLALRRARVGARVRAPWRVELDLDRPGALSAGEWERIGEIAVQHRERLDGSGYPRGLSGGAISPAGPGALGR